MKNICFIVLMVLCHQALWAQNLTGIGDQKPFDFKGRVNFGLSQYETNRERPQFNPFSYTFNANATISLYGINIPFTLIYSEKQRSFRQPFNKIGASPEYKWVKVHIGQRNINFNRYTLAGRTFLGYGVELNPGILRLGFIKGRFNREVRNVAGIESFIEPAFERTGWAARLGVGNNQNHFDLSFFRGTDDVPVDDIPVNSESEFGNLKPAENIALGVEGSFVIAKNIRTTFNVAGSAFTDNTLSREIDEDSDRLGILNRLFTPRINTDLKFAGDIQIRYSDGPFNLTGGYKRIESDYKSMGAYRFLTDIEDVTLSPSFYMFKRQLKFSITYGIQRNNLSDLKLQQTKRTIGSFNLNYQSKKNLSSSFSYSNFKSNVISVDEMILSDSFDILQVSENMNGRLQIPVGIQNVNSISLSAGRQKFNREIMVGLNDDQNISQNVQLLWNHRPVKESIGYSVGINALEIRGRNVQRRLGGRASIQKMFAKKLKMSLYSSAFQTIVDNVNTGTSFNSSLRLRYAVSKKQSLQFSFRFLNRSSKISAARTYTDIRSKLNYSARF